MISGDGFSPMAGEACSGVMRLVGSASCARLFDHWAMVLPCGGADRRDVFDIIETNMLLVPMRGVAMLSSRSALLVEAPNANERLRIEQFGKAIARVGPEAAGLLIGPDRQLMALPKPLYEALLRVAHVLAAGQGMTIVPADRLLTTQEAADMLDMSRTYLIRLLDEGKIPFQRIGRHRRITMHDVSVFADSRRRERREHLRRLRDLSEEYGLYDHEDKTSQYFLDLGASEKTEG
jgi:excisionase family DNA binding protein